MVYYVCPNCGHKSDEYKQSMVHYNSCDTIRVRPFNSPPSSSFVEGADSPMFQQGVAGVMSTNGGWNGNGGSAAKADAQTDADRAKPPEGQAAHK